MDEMTDGKCLACYLALSTQHNLTIITFFSNFFLNRVSGGTWVVQWVKQLTLGFRSGYDLRVVRLSLPLPLPPPPTPE